MANNEEGEEIVPRGNDWEVVSLTASAYAAAPGPDQVGLGHYSGDNTSEENKAESSRPLFMSGHFVFPPKQHENLPLEEATATVVQPVANIVSDEKPGEILSMEPLTPVESPGIQICHGKRNILSASGADFEKNVVSADEMSIPSNASRSATDVEKSDSGVESDDESSDSGFSESSEGKKLGSDDFPLESWWRKKAVAFCSLAKETNTFWSILVAAAVMGLVIIGHRWQQEKWQVFHLGRFCPIDEKMSRMIGRMSRLKDAVVGGQRRGSAVRGGASN